MAGDTSATGFRVWVIAYVYTPTMRLRMLLFGVAVVSIGLGGIASGQVITEFATPTYFSPNAIVGGPGSLYFTTLENERIGRISLDGTMVLFGDALTTPCGLSSLKGSATLAIGTDGNIWITPDCGREIIFLPPPVGAGIAILATNGAVVRQSLVRSLPTDMTLGPDGNMWFSGDEFGRYSMGGIWRITDTFLATRFDIPPSSSTVAMGVAVGRDGNVWFTEEGIARVGYISTNGVITQFDLPSSDRRPFFITSGPDGNLWFTESSVDGSKSWIGRVTTSGFVTEFPLTTTTPIGFARITSGPDGNLWFTEPGVFGQPLGKIGRITPDGLITEFVTPTPASSPTGIAAGPDGNVWFTEPSKQKIGRITTSGTPSCSTDSHTLCLNNGRFSVAASFTESPEGLPVQATAVPLTADTGYFWFFDPANVELVVKVLTGCSVNNEYWVFAGGLTDVGVEMKITDTVTGKVKMYSNTVGTPFQPIQDSSAFSCP